MPLPPTASEALRQFRKGTLTLGAYRDACFAAIDKDEGQVGAFAHLDRDAEWLTSSNGLLQGIPIGVKDLIDTENLPTEFNSPLYQKHQAGKDAACVAVLRAQGAAITGKTTTVEFASLGRVPETRNPHNHGHTPGGSSSGSAAAVACGMVPIALGTQTGGSTIRPAAFCGVAALKPTFGIVPTEGLRPYAPSLDTIGWMTRSVEDLQRVLDCFHPLEETPALISPMRIALYRTAYWDNAAKETRDALQATTELLEARGVIVERVDGPAGDEKLNLAQDIVMHGEGRISYQAEFARWPNRLHPEQRDEIENVKKISDDDLRWAYDYLAAMRPKMEATLRGFDACLTPATPGEAPAGIESTGDAVFNRLWTALHMPCITLPHFRGPNNLPVGIQLVAPRFRDRQLLAVAAVIETWFNEA